MESALFLHFHWEVFEELDQLELDEWFQNDDYVILELGPSELSLPSPNMTQRASTNANIQTAEKIKA